MVGEIGVALGSIKSALDIAKSLKEINDRVALNGAVINLQEQILAAQSATMAVQERIRELEATVRAHDSWEAQARRYKLVDRGANTFAWQLKEEAADGEPIHLICPKCYEEKKRAILQFKHTTAAKQELYQCSSCNGEFFFGAYQPQSYSRIPRASGWAV